MKTANFLLCLVAIVISPVIGAPENYGRIANGVATMNEKAPYIVRILHDRMYCGGSMLSPNYVLTAGHCAHNRNSDGFTIIANITSIYDEGIRRKVSQVFVHPDYQIFANDIALLELSEPIYNAATIDLCRQPVKEGDKLDVFGWGRLGNGKGAAEILQTAEVPVRSQKDCDEEYGYRPNRFCGSGLDNSSACMGDSGGPAVLNGELCGLVSFGSLCGEVGVSSGYADVYALKWFIRKYTGLNLA